MRALPRDPAVPSNGRSEERASRRGFLLGLIGLGAFEGLVGRATGGAASRGIAPEALAPSRGALPRLSVKCGPGFVLCKDLRLVSRPSDQGEPRSIRDLDAVEVRDPEPWLAPCGRGDALSPRRREAVIARVHELCCSLRLRMHLRFAAEDGLYFEPDGRPPRPRLEGALVRLR